MNRLFKVVMCYEPDTLSARDCLEIIDRTNFLAPIMICSNTLYSRESKYSRKKLQKLADQNTATDIELEAERVFGYLGGPRLSLTNVRGMQCLYRKSVGADAVSLELLDELACSSGFRAGYGHDSEDTFWQGMTQVSEFSTFNRPCERLPKVWNTDLNRWDIDVRRNPARRDAISTMWLQAAWRMWFGAEAQLLIPKDILLAFPDATSIRTLPCGTIFLQLFDDPWAFADPENRRRQQAFRDYADFDAIIENSHKVKNPDCHGYLYKGNFEYGGVRRIVEWQNDEGRSVLRSRATQREIREQNEYGELLKRWVVKGRYEGQVGVPDELGPN